MAGVQNAGLPSSNIIASNAAQARMKKITHRQNYICRGVEDATPITGVSRQRLRRSTYRTEFDKFIRDFLTIR